MGWHELTAGVAADLTDTSAGQAVQLMFRLLVAGLLGALLGWERQRLHKSAGLRTHILVAVGSAAFMAVPQQAGVGSDGLTRVLQGLVAGIGFLAPGASSSTPPTTRSGG